MIEVKGQSSAASSEEAHASVVLRDNPLEMPEEPQPRTLVCDGEEGTGVPVAQDEGCETKRSSISRLSEAGGAGRRTDAARLERDGRQIADGHVPADLELVDLDQQDPRHGENDDERVLGRRQVEVCNVGLVEVTPILDVLEPVLTECFALRVRLDREWMVSFGGGRGSESWALSVLG